MRASLTIPTLANTATIWRPTVIAADSVRRSTLIVRLFAGVHFLLALATAWSMAPTYDEPAHIEYGVKVLGGDASRGHGRQAASKMPVSVLNGLPRVVGRALSSIPGTTGLSELLSDIRVARLATVMASVGLLLLVAAWAGELYGPDAAAAAAVLYAFSPNLLAHGSLATTDLYAAAGAFAASYAFWRFVRAPSRGTMVIAAAAVGVAQLTKFSAVLLLPIQLVTAIVMLVGHPEPRREKVWALTRYFALAVVMMIVIVNVGFLFRAPFQRLSDFHFQSTTFLALQKIPILSSIPLPFPAPYIQGFDLMRNHERTGLFVPSIYLAGELRLIGSPGFRPFPHYYALLYLLKEPIVLQVLVALALIGLIRRRDGHFRENEWFVLCPLAGYLLHLSLFVRMQTGIRFVLPSLALSLVLSAGVLRNWSQLRGRRALVAAGAMVWLTASVLSYFPQMIPYTNEFIWNRATAWRWYAGSNISWGQNNGLVHDYLQQHPEVRLNPLTPTSGKVLVRVNDLVGIRDDRRYAWLRQYEPTGHVGYGHILFDVPAGARGMETVAGNVRPAAAVETP